MITFIFEVLTCWFTVWLIYRLGYEAGHRTIAEECERLGSFYVGKKTYRCVEITEAKTSEHNE